MLCGAGYAVFFANPRGSSGYGDDFSSVLTGHWGEMEHEDLMAGIDLLVEKGITDPDRLGVCGLSYGGYMTCYMVGQTDRFKAAVSENPITDLFSRYATTDIGPSFSPGEMGGLPYEIPEVYRRGSPTVHAHQCSTPTLLIQGEADYRCTAEQSEEFYGILRANGCTVEMLRFPNCSHLGAITGPTFVREAQNTALLEWMNRYVLGKD
jgi:dipeptidyl aminopeptidase/acylaminoacyl peptidase